MMKSGTRKRSSSAGSEKMERVGGRQKKMEGHCLTGQSPQWAVVPMEEEEGGGGGRGGGGEGGEGGGGEGGGGGGGEGGGGGGGEEDEEEEEEEEELGMEMKQSA